MPMVPDPAGNGDVEINVAKPPGESDGEDDGFFGTELGIHGEESGDTGASQR